MSPKTHIDGRLSSWDKAVRNAGAACQEVRLTCGQSPECSILVKCALHKGGGTGERERWMFSHLQTCRTWVCLKKEEPQNQSAAALQPVPLDIRYTRCLYSHTIIYLAMKR